VGDLRELDWLAQAPRKIVRTSTYAESPWFAIADQSTWSSWCADCLGVEWIEPNVRRARFRLASFTERVLVNDFADGRGRFAFDVVSSTLPGLRRAVEDWVIDGNALTWTIAVDVPALAWPIARRILDATFARTERGLARFVAD
jgi:hypothetical protein